MFGVPIPTDAPLKPTLSYPTSKAAASIALIGWAVENNVFLQILRIFQVYGEGELETRLWPSLKKYAKLGKDFPMTKGEQIRDFISVDQVAKKFLNEIEFTNVDRSSPRILNIGSGKPQSVLDFSQYWWNKWNAKGDLLIGKIPYKQSEIMRYVPKL